jgi:lambda family phage portal protein
MNFASMTQLVFRAWMANGEALALPLWLERVDTPFRTCLQLVETDRLSNPEGEPTSARLRGGVEMDVYGRPLAYHVQRQLEGTPLELYAFLGGGYATLGSIGLLEWDRIPAETDWGRKRVLHLYTQDRVDQTRGKPLLSPVIEQFRMLDSYQRTELQSSIVNSLVAGVITTPMDPVAIAEMVGGDPNKYLSEKGEYRPQMEGGSLVPLYPGDELTPFVPARPAPQFSNFVEAVIRQIGAAIGLPYELVLKDFSKTNYSSARAALLEAWRFFIGRRTWLSIYWCSAVYKLWFEEAVSAGMIDAPNFYELMPFYLRSKWIGPGRGWIDPVKEAQAAQIRLGTMISTLELECAEQGLDWNEVQEQRALELERARQLGLAAAMPPQGAKPEPPDDPDADDDAEEEGGEEDGEEGDGEEEDAPDEKARKAA